MSRKKALEIIRNLEKTISSMTEDLPVSNEQFPPARVKKSKLVSIQSKLLKKFKIKITEYRLV
tara:strand:- start:246 stop:434 length:189 start_codon:yes stop_codon:yes gene_type:complete